MSYQQRDTLVDQIVQVQPSLNGFVRDRSADAFDGSWDLVSYSFERGFEAFWDLAKADASGLLQMPLLSLWRQSIELERFPADESREGDSHACADVIHGAGWMEAGMDGQAVVDGSSFPSAGRG